ncbi:hypothetical protein PIB30_081235 [Stylosanthes scabra]|uniref:Uncharacterized protein n=1 Tax=Stylosanthes scabra TaxID=79078 RepID=A0ABU6UQF7_9FABA|nr:hypothetical protein [Stylosanthes scabra]
MSDPPLANWHVSSSSEEDPKEDPAWEGEQSSDSSNGGGAVFEGYGFYWDDMLVEIQTRGRRDRPGLGVSYGYAGREVAPATSSNSRNGSRISTENVTEVQPTLKIPSIGLGSFSLGSRNRGPHTAGRDVALTASKLTPFLQSLALRDRQLRSFTHFIP